MEDSYKDTISPKVRKVLYWVYFAVSAVVLLIQAWCTAPGWDAPSWLSPLSQAVLVFGAIFGFQAAIYTPRTPVSAVKPVDDGLATIEPVEEPADVVSASVGSPTINISAPEGADPEVIGKRFASSVAVDSDVLVP